MKIGVLVAVCQCVSHWIELVRVVIERTACWIAQCMAGEHGFDYIVVRTISGGSIGVLRLRANLTQLSGYQLLYVAEASIANAI